MAWTDCSAEVVEKAEEVIGLVQLLVGPHVTVMQAEQNRYAFLAIAQYQVPGDDYYWTQDVPIEKVFLDPRSSAGLSCYARQIAEQINKSYMKASISASRPDLLDELGWENVLKPESEGADDEDAVGD